jgi:L-lactate dehydrogenase (cytochrome)
VRLDVELDAVGRRLARAADIDDLRAMARRRLPGGVFDYIDGAAEDETTLDRNRRAFLQATFHPRVLIDVSRIDPSTELFGERLPLPLLLAPTGFTRIAHPEGELAVARAAARRGIPYSLSTLATRSIEEVAAVEPTGPRWFQVYMWRDRGMVRSMVERAEGSGYRGVLLTVDTAVFGRRERDVRRGFTLPPKVGLQTLFDGVRHPAWSLDLLRNDPITFANVAGDATRDGSTAVSLSDFINEQFDASISWRDLEWLASITRLPILLKGVVSGADAKAGADAGVAGIVVSNHGGRQLDGAPATLEALPGVVEAVGDRLPVLLDGGVRRGRDVVAAVALGAAGVFIGRPYLYGLAVAGERGVDHVLQQFDAGVRRTLALLGRTSFGELHPTDVTLGRR